MKLELIAVGQKMPSWIQEGFSTYQKRFPPHFKLELHELAPAKRISKALEAKAKELESQAILKALPKKAYIIALDEHGKQYSSQQLAQKVDSWQSLGCDIVLIIGGPNGLTDEVLNRADELWSLSQLTLPHPLVRVFVAETIYRALSIYQGLPYHREE